MGELRHAVSNGGDGIFQRQQPKPAPIIVDFLLDKSPKIPGLVVGFKVTEKPNRIGVEQLPTCAGGWPNNGKRGHWRSFILHRQVDGQMIKVNEDKIYRSLVEASANKGKRLISGSWSKVSVTWRSRRLPRPLACHRQPAPEEFGEAPLCESSKLTPIRQHPRKRMWSRSRHTSLELASFGATDVGEAKKQIDTGLSQFKFFPAAWTYDRLAKDLENLSRTLTPAPRSDRNRWKSRSPIRGLRDLLYTPVDSARPSSANR